jgi:hypothetical protein
LCQQQHHNVPGYVFSRRGAALCFAQSSQLELHLALLCYGCWQQHMLGFAASLVGSGWQLCLLLVVHPAQQTPVV